MMKIHCPDCQIGILRNVTNIEEIKRINPFSRAILRENKRNNFPSPTYVLMFCDKCKHMHDMDSRSLKNSKKPPSIKIKGYGIHHMR